MTRFDRYILSLLMVFFGFFSLVLVLVYWVNRAALLFDQLIGDGQSAMVFLEFSALTVPNVMRLVLPISAFAATVYATHRLSSESELVVVQSMGFSSYRLARPVLYFGIIVAVLMSILTNILVPLSTRALAERTAEMAENITARFLVDGTFLHPSDGITFYIREFSDNGELLDIFMSDVRNPERTTTYTAKRALLIREESGPKLLMFDGMVETLSKKSGRLSTTRFSDFVFDIGSLINPSGRSHRSAIELTTFELITAGKSVMKLTGETRSALIYEGHLRFTQPLLAIVASLLGFSTLLLGNFSRAGLWRQILGAILLLIFIKLIDNSVAGIARSDASKWWVLYVPTGVGAVISFLLLWISARPKRRRQPFIAKALS